MGCCGLEARRLLLRFPISLIVVPISLIRRFKMFSLFRNLRYWHGSVRRCFPVISGAPLCVPMRSGAMKATFDLENPNGIGLLRIRNYYHHHIRSRAEHDTAVRTRFAILIL